MEAELIGEDVGTAQLVFEWLIIVVLICMSGLFSGLTLGLMGLDTIGLEIIMKSGDNETERAYAGRIYPVRKMGNLLLCTLLLGNVAVNALMPILLAGKTSPLVSFLLSTVVIVVFGEIAPQAACSRYALWVGGHTVWLVYIFLFLLFPVAYPVSLALDFVLGEELGTIYSRRELATLVQLHSTSQASDLSRGEAHILKHALEFSSKRVVEVMTKLDDVYMLEVSGKLDPPTLDAISEQGFSRVPVYEGKRENVIGFLFVKDLALVDPDDALPLRTVLQLFPRNMPNVFEQTTLDKMLGEFKSGRSHMAMVYRVEANGPGDPYPENIGIVTLEDVIEELIGLEILDETDVFVDNEGTVKAPARSRQRANILRRQRFDTSLTGAQLDAVYSFLLHNKLFSSLHTDVMRKMLGSAAVISVKPPLDLYTRGVQDHYFSLILSGKVTVLSGEEEFESEKGQFGVLGIGALQNDSFVPDYTVRVKEAAQLVRIGRKLYRSAVAASDKAREGKPWKLAKDRSDSLARHRQQSSAELGKESLRHNTVVVPQTEPHVNVLQITTSPFWFSSIKGRSGAYEALCGARAEPLECICWPEYVGGDGDGGNDESDESLSRVDNVDAYNADYFVLSWFTDEQCSPASVKHQRVTLIRTKDRRSISRLSVVSGTPPHEVVLKFDSMGALLGALGLRPFAADVMRDGENTEDEKEKAAATAEEIEHKLSVTASPDVVTSGKRKKKSKKQKKEAV